MNFNDELQRIIAERDRLRAALEDLTADRDSWIEQASARAADAVTFMQERDAARAEVEALRADAERYRHLKSLAGFNDERDMGPGGHWWIDVRVDRRPVNNTLDAAIDAARAAQGGEHG